MWFHGNFLKLTIFTEFSLSIGYASQSRDGKTEVINIVFGSSSPEKRIINNGDRFWNQLSQWIHSSFIKNIISPNSAYLMLQFLCFLIILDFSFKKSKPFLETAWVYQERNLTREKKENLEKNIFGSKTFSLSLFVNSKT